MNTYIVEVDKRYQCGKNDDRLREVGREDLRTLAGRAAKRFKKGQHHALPADPAEGWREERGTVLGRS